MGTPAKWEVASCIFLELAFHFPGVSLRFYTCGELLAQGGWSVGFIVDLPTSRSAKRQADLLAVASV